MTSDSHISRGHEDQDPVSRIMRATSEACSRWFMAMRCCIRRERVRQQLFREENGLPREARLPYEPQPLTSAEEAIAESSEAIIRSLFGDVPADYARDKFRHAISTGDMRSFKIRLVILKARDSLVGTDMHGLFITHVEECISHAEVLAGCKPDPTPRRLSKAEQDKKRLREEALSLKDRNQMKLPLEWPDDDCSHRYSDDQDVDSAKNTKKTNKTESSENGRYDGDPESKAENDCVTVTQDIEEPCYTNDESVASGDDKVVRKTRDYDSVDEILQDIEDGNIVPYDSIEEILEDMKSGAISQVEAFMFVTALEQYNPSDEQELEKECEEADSRYDDEDDGNVDDDDECYGHGADRGPRTSFSYNPRGFAGCDSVRGDEDW